MTNDSSGTGHASYSVIVVGGGVAGLSAAVFTARHGLETLVVDAGESILRRNAHLENFPGFPAGVNARRLLDLLGEQAEAAGCERVKGTVVRVVEIDDGSGFIVKTDAGDRYPTEYVVAATKNELDYMADVDGVGIIDRGKAFVDVDEYGRTGIEGLYAAGRIAEKAHQTVVAAGHGAEVGLAILEDDDRPFYHDWVAPQGYFTHRGRDLPPGCEEIDDAERDRRESNAMSVMQDRFAERHPDEQETHPSLDG